MKMQSVRFSELAGCKVSHGCLQHHHHPWRHHHRRQHNQHDVHQLCSKWFDLQDSHDGSFASTCPAFFLWLRWSSSRGLQVIAFQRTKQLDNFDNFHNILIPFCPSFPSIRIYLLLNYQSSLQASSCIVRHCPSSQVRQCCLWSTDVTVFMLMMQMTILVVCNFTVMV